MIRLLFVMLLLAPLPSMAQSTVRTIPFGMPTANLSGTIASTGVFQSIQAANTERKGCLIQNNSTHNMNVYFGPIASATTGNSVVVTAATIFNCASGGIIPTDQVSITGTTADAFTANFQ